MNKFLMLTLVLGSMDKAYGNGELAVAERFQALEASFPTFRQQAEPAPVAATVSETAQPAAPYDATFFDPNPTGVTPLRLTDRLEVTFDITQSVRPGTMSVSSNGKATVKLNGVVIKTYPISAGCGFRKKTADGYTCAVTPTGTFVPTGLNANKRNKDNAPMNHFIQLDKEREIGPHAGDISGCSGGCIRQQGEMAKWLFNQVKAVSYTRPDGVFQSNAVFHIVNNRPSTACSPNQSFRAQPLVAGGQPIRAATGRLERRQSPMAQPQPNKQPHITTVVPTIQQ